MAAEPDLVRPRLMTTEEHAALAKGAGKGATPITAEALFAQKPK